MDQIIFIYLCCPDQEVAERIVKKALEGKLIACANIMPAHKAHYEWDGELKQRYEHAVILKTVAARLSEVEAVVREHHPDDCPSMAALPVAGGMCDFLEFIRNQTIRY